ncbi:Dak phosphatase [Gottschalkia purinilytica]|uniref:Dak phosphatase n=1 Tax=Gottschalkia purinilytica TaxID=1503 RepID=A0A0L0WB75_GOTPU|nr:DAK2 domain-containing protein [Gottschalkia purinilytica]KNF08753.1 Dak phosphatase [Gottschalkia purinilytica]
MKIEYVDGLMLSKMFLGAANSLEKNKEIVNSLNVFPVPDGDTGTNMSLTMQSAVRQLKNLDTQDIDKISSVVANGSLMGARGNSGVILSQLLRGFSKGLKGRKRIDTKIASIALKEGADTAYKAVMKPIEGTILTVARECAEKSIEISRTETDVVVFLKKVIEHGEIALNKTPEMLPVLKQAGVVDAGGKGLLTLLSGALEVLTGKEEISYDSIENTKHNVQPNPISDDITFGYCTEFIINNTDADNIEFRDKIQKLGDSILVVGGDNIIKVHIHTDDPGLVLQQALGLGELIDIKIDNMRYQHRNNVFSEEDNQTNEIEAVEETKKYGFITVSMGEGLKEIFNDLKVDHVISGGQTMNPSTEDILNAVNNINAENIIILPNNSNIVLAANQAKELSEKNIEVLPTKTIPQGVTALLAFNEEASIEENIENMTKAFKSIKTGQITFSVRDTSINDREINKDDIIGICDGDITSVGKDIKEVAIDLIRNTINEETELITLFYGEGITEEQANELREILEEEFDYIDIEIIYGGQPLYYYLIAIE